jgi:hypothetical protein
VKAAAEVIDEEEEIATLRPANGDIVNRKENREAGTKISGH